MTRVEGRKTVTVAEYAESTGDKPDTVRKRIRSGRIAARDLSGGIGGKRRYRIPRRELERRLEQLSSGAASTM